MDQCWDLQLLKVFWGCCGSRLDYRDFALCILGSLNVCSGESSTLTLFLRVMDTFDDDDDDFNTSTLQHFETSSSPDVQTVENYLLIFLQC